MVEEFAAAKVNLTLHITGQRADGYHLLDSLVAFADVGDTVRAEPADQISLKVDGPEAASVPLTDDNSVVMAARHAAPGTGARLHLTKVLPVASGIGGGTADAAAAFRAMRRLTGHTDAPRVEDVEALGADVPVCLFSRTARMRGIGERLDFVDLPRLPAVLVNPRVEVSTPAVFKRIAHKDNSAMPDIPVLADVSAVAAWLGAQRNDMQAAAIDLVPPIAQTLEVLGHTEPLLARMSGSGATCFGIYADDEAARNAAAQISKAHPDWWVAPCHLS
ncbi:4-diphosphocytidyl-2-C-methyl-D-erythritol kinase [Litoreibacter ponti]|uniref:4-diphosphocytidyl-2-C-methyl-D-erythritol kinase n=1 Tax=Litoreibacter ponti TaxID=1510457 RepID=A0A2T6BMN5_9RHOB|nr:4-(cytidine 5'-diphospho)-2-C-methyl-D-erythritol kinase [Litoreibacter ponti]PTX57348.1 4-diphosphocytidyl-2-C-methyl-D-erythritol kinase [Litoreibacter ponti]